MNRERNGVGPSVLRSLIVFSILLSVAGVLSAQEVSASGGEVFNLEYVEDGFRLGVAADILTDTQRFEKEPDLGERAIVRGRLLTGTEEDNWTGFAWDRSKGTLYVDLNRNRDLTDDPEGVFQSDRRADYQIFHDVRLKMAGDAELEYVLDVYVYKFGSSRPHCNAVVTSGFQGQFELGGRKWRLAVTDNMDGKIDSGDSFFLDLVDGGIDGSLRDYRLRSPAPEVLTFGGHSYNTSFAFHSDQNGQSIRVKFAHTESSMGQLKIDGKFIKRLTLARGPSLVMLDSPEDIVSVPAGDYYLQSVFLDGGEAGQFVGQLDSGVRVTIGENQVATLKVGAPLANSLTVTSFGRTLRLGYSLKGIDGHEYRSLNENRDNPPRFIVKKDGEEIASGNFEYG